MNENPLELIELELAILIRRITSTSPQKKIGNLDRSAYLLLHQIATKGAAGVKALAEEFKLDISTVSRQTATLEQKELLYRIPDPTDGRAYSLQITDQGIRALQEDKIARKKRVAEITEDWSDVDREAFGELLRKFNFSAIQK